MFSTQKMTYKNTSLISVFQHLPPSLLEVCTCPWRCPPTGATAPRWYWPTTRPTSLPWCPWSRGTSSVSKVKAQLQTPDLALTGHTGASPGVQMKAAQQLEKSTRRLLAAQLLFPVPYSVSVSCQKSVSVLHHIFSFLFLPTAFLQSCSPTSNNRVVGWLTLDYCFKPDTEPQTALDILLVAALRGSLHHHSMSVWVNG